MEEFSKLDDNKEETIESNEEEQINISPVSSLASNRKLEWDSGADIGYNVHDSLKSSRKCKSYPILNIDLSSIGNTQKSDEIHAGDIAVSASQFPKFHHSTPMEKDKTEINKNVDECLQTTLIPKCSKSVQTDKCTCNKSRSQSEQSSNSTSGSSSASKSSSFQYIPGSKPDSSARSSSSQNETSESPLGKMISTQQSKHLITDIDKSLVLLQKFLISKNYSTATKKHYAKKVVSKIIQNKYASDSSESRTSTSLNSSSVSKRSKTKSETNSTSDNILEEEPKLNCLKEFINRSVQCDTKTYRNCAIQCVDNNEINLEKNWRDGKTLSERLFEAKKKYSKTAVPKLKSKCDDLGKNSDYLLQHTKKEKQRQLTWINNEMIYLRKLYDLLQSKDFSTSLSSNSTEASSKSKSSPANETNSNKLSQILTNDQIKILIHKEGKAYESDGQKDEQPKNGLQKSINSSEGAGDNCKNSTYNSHIYSNLISKPTNVDVSIQCKLGSTANSSSTRTPSSKSVDLVFDNNKNFTNSETSADRENLSANEESRMQTIKSLSPGNNAESIAYFLTFEEVSLKEFQLVPNKKSLKNVTVKVPHLRNDKVKKDKKINNCWSLQDYLKHNRPDFMMAAEGRRFYVNKPNVVLEQKNLFTCQELKEITQKRYKKLPEVQSKIKYNKVQNQRRHNRHMANLFSKKLQRKTLQGQMSLSTCVSVL